MARDEAIARDHLSVHTEITAPVLHQFVELLKGAFIKQQFHSLTRGEFAFFVPAFTALRTTTLFGSRVAEA